MTHMHELSKAMEKETAAETEAVRLKKKCQTCSIRGRQSFNFTSKTSLICFCSCVNKICCVAPNGSLPLVMPTYVTHLVVSLTRSFISRADGADVHGDATVPPDTSRGSVV